MDLRTLALAGLPAAGRAPPRQGPRRGRDAGPADRRDPGDGLDADVRRLGASRTRRRRGRRSRRCARTRTSPLLDRATLGRYVPGSVFKIVTAIAGLGSGSVTPATTYPEQPAAEEDGLVVDGFTIRDGHHAFTGDEELDLLTGDRGLVQHLVRPRRPRHGRGEPGRLRPAARIRRAAPVRPADRRVAADERRRARSRAASLDDVELANAAYGQGEVLATPLQMALVAAAVANGGELMEPRLATALVDRQGRATTIEAALDGTRPRRRRPTPRSWRR